MGTVPSLHRGSRRESKEIPMIKVGELYWYHPKYYNHLSGHKVLITEVHGNTIGFRGQEEEVGTEWYDDRKCFRPVKSYWRTPFEWLEDHLDFLSRDALVSEFKQLILKLDPEIIYELYQDEMEEDGFFKEKA
jgi:hypothetical protein